MSTPILDRPLPPEAWAPRSPLGPGRRSATDRVPLGRTGCRIGRLGLGTGSEGGAVQRAMGQDAFTAMVRHAFDRGIEYLTVGDNYIHQPPVQRGRRVEGGGGHQ